MDIAVERICSIVHPERAARSDRRCVGCLRCSHSLLRERNLASPAEQTDDHFKPSQLEVAQQYAKLTEHAERAVPMADAAA